MFGKYLKTFYKALNIPPVSFRFKWDVCTAFRGIKSCRSFASK